MSDSHPEPTTPEIDFAPVPVRPRHDGWTPARQRSFVKALAETGCVDRACRQVGLSANGAYTLRRRVDAIEFRAAWDAALDFAIGRLDHAVVSRAIHGVEMPHYYQGEQVGSHRVYNDRLAMWLLRFRAPERYGVGADRAPRGRHPQRVVFVLAQRLDHMLQAAAGLLPRLGRRLLRVAPDLDGDAP